MTFSFQMLENDQQKIETALNQWHQWITDPIDTRGIPSLLQESMAHSLLAGGKRLRPLLVLPCRPRCLARQTQKTKFGNTLKTRL